MRQYFSNRERAMPWFRSKQRLAGAPTDIAESLHRVLARKQTAPETFHIPDDDFVRARFREKIAAYQEATVLLALVSRVKPLQNGTNEDPLFEPVLREYERIIFAASSEPSMSDRRQVIGSAYQDLADRMYPPEGQTSASALNWSQAWFSNIGFHETNPWGLLKLFNWWADYRTLVDRSLDAVIK